jgi:hypothetical protein
MQIKSSSNADVFVGLAEPGTATDISHAAGLVFRNETSEVLWVDVDDDTWLLLCQREVQIEVVKHESGIRLHARSASAPKYTGKEVYLTGNLDALGGLAPQWPRPIPVSERVPAIDGDCGESGFVFAWADSREVWEIAWLSAEGNWTWGDGHDRGAPEFWMEMPPAPQ